MKRYPCLLIAFFALIVTDSAFAQGVAWRTFSRFDQALAAAKQSNKPIFVDFYTVWCGPCKALEKEVYPRKEAGDLLNNQFIALKFDAEKGEGIQLAKRFTVQGYPTLLVVLPDGNVADRVTGYGGRPDFLRWLGSMTKSTAQPGAAENGSASTQSLDQLKKTIRQARKNVTVNQFKADTLFVRYGPQLGPDSLFRFFANHLFASSGLAYTFMKAELNKPDTSVLAVLKADRESYGPLVGAWGEMCSFYLKQASYANDRPGFEQLANQFTTDFPFFADNIQDARQRFLRTNDKPAYYRFLDTLIINAAAIDAATHKARNEIERNKEKARLAKLIANKKYEVSKDGKFGFVRGAGGVMLSETTASSTRYSSSQEILTKDAFFERLYATSDTNLIRQHINRVETLLKNSGVSPYEGTLTALAMAYYKLNNKAQAMALLDKAFVEMKRDKTYQTAGEYEMVDTFKSRKILRQRMAQRVGFAQLPKPNVD